MSTPLTLPNGRCKGCGKLIAQPCMYCRDVALRQSGKWKPAAEVDDNATECRQNLQDEILEVMEEGVWVQAQVIAFEVASSDPNVRQALAKLVEKGLVTWRIDESDIRSKKRRQYTKTGDIIKAPPMGEISRPEPLTTRCERAVLGFLEGGKLATVAEISRATGQHGEPVRKACITLYRKGKVDRSAIKNRSATGGAPAYLYSLAGGP